MKTEISYDQKCQDCNDRKALLDTLHWFGQFQQFKMLVKAVKGGCAFKQLAFWAGFGGVQGYPVNAIWRRYHAEKHV